MVKTSDIKLHSLFPRHKFFWDSAAKRPRNQETKRSETKRLRDKEVKWTEIQWKETKRQRDPETKRSRDKAIQSYLNKKNKKGSVWCGLLGFPKSREVTNRGFLNVARLPVSRLGTLQNIYSFIFLMLMPLALPRLGAGELHLIIDYE